MKCKNCIAWGKDFISDLCVISHSIEDNNVKDHGCRLNTKTIRRRLDEVLKETPRRYKLYNTDFKVK